MIVCWRKLSESGRGIILWFSDVVSPGSNIWKGGRRWNFRFMRGSIRNVSSWHYCLHWCYPSGFRGGGCCLRSWVIICFTGWRGGSDTILLLTGKRWNIVAIRFIWGNGNHTLGWNGTGRSRCRLRNGRMIRRSLNDWRESEWLERIENLIAGNLIIEYLVIEYLVIE